MLRANVGCGMTPTRGWRNFDNSFSLRLARHGALASLAGRLGLVSGEQRQFIEFCRRERIEWADWANPDQAAVRDDGIGGIFG